MKETLDEPQFGRMHAWGCAEMLSGQHVRPLSKNYFEHWPNENAQFGTFRLLVRRADHSVTLPP